MDRLRDALKLLVQAGMSANELNDKLTKMGYSNTPYAALYGQIFDAVYRIVGEDTENMHDSATWTAMHAPLICDDRRADLLMYAYRQNHTQPKPNTAEEEEIIKMARENGGYVPGRFPKHMGGNPECKKAEKITPEAKKKFYQSPEGDYWP